MSDIRNALLKLDPNDHDQWTTGGLPRLDVVSHHHGSNVTRAEATKAWPEFNRDLALQGLKDVPASVVDEAEAPQQRSGAEIEQELAAAPVSKQPVEIDEAYYNDENDAIALIEKAITASQSDRYRHNYDLQAFLRSFYIQQTAIRMTQKRIDERNERRNKQD